MSSYNILAKTTENTVVAEYTPPACRPSAPQGEADLERELIKMLSEQGYEVLENIHGEEDLAKNIRVQLEKTNSYKFTESEWERFLYGNIANPNEHVVEKTRKIHDDNVQVLKRDDGSSKNIVIFDKKNIHNNSLQVIHQYAVGKKNGAEHSNRYDVTILVNGFPMVHIELKRRGVAIRKAFDQIVRYGRESFSAGLGLFEYIQIFVVSNGTNTKYYSNSTRYNAEKKAASGYKTGKTSDSFEFTSFWADGNNKIIPDLVDFTKTFFARNTILNILAKYCVFTSENMLLVMRPYQIVATERILNRIDISTTYKKYGTTEAGGYIWHTTGSGKTLTSFKTAQLASKLDYIDKVVFVVDRKDLDYQTMREYDRFEKGAANSNSSTAVLKRQMEDDNCRIIITTIQKLSIFVKNNASHPVYGKHVVFIFDECHRSQFGEMHIAIAKAFKKYHLFGFTGTPIFAENAMTSGSPYLYTTEQAFGDQLHAYNIQDAIADGNVLPFHIDYIKTMDVAPGIVDKNVRDIDRESAYLNPKRISMITGYILEHFTQKTYRNSGWYSFRTIQNVSGVVQGKGKVEEERQRKAINGFNSIMCVASIRAAKLYYEEFKRQMEEDPSKKLRVALIYSYEANAPEEGGFLMEENPEDTSALEKSDRDFLEYAISDYNTIFHTNYSTDGDRFQSYYKDVSLRMKNREIDLLIVVNMFLTGYDAPTLNTLWVDKNLRMHGLMQAFSRPNRILNSVKAFGNIVCFRNLQKEVDEAIALFGDPNASGLILLRTFDDYYQGYIDENGIVRTGYCDAIRDLTSRFPLTEPRIIGEKNQKDFIALFGSVLRMRNLLTAFDEFEGQEILSERDFQDYLSRYQDLRDEWAARRKTDKEYIGDDVVFELELVQQVEVNVDYVLALVQKYHDSHCKDKEILVRIRNAVGSSPMLRSKKALIEAFIEGINDMEDVFASWKQFVAEEREKQIQEIISTERLDEEKARKYIDDCFRSGEVKTTGTDIDGIMPPVSRFGDEDRSARRLALIDKLVDFFDQFYGI